MNILFLVSVGAVVAFLIHSFTEYSFSNWQFHAISLLSITVIIFAALWIESIFGIRILNKKDPDES